MESARELSMTVVLGRGTTTGASSLPDPSDDLKEQNNEEKGICFKVSILNGRLIKA